MTNRAHWLVAAGALAVAAFAAPLAIAFTGAAGQVIAAPACLATVTANGSDPVCVSYSNGNGVNLGTPFGIYGPNGSPGGINGPLLPGQTWNRPIA